MEHYDAHHSNTVPEVIPEIVEDEYHSSLEQPERRAAIFAVYSELTPSTRQYLEIWADRLVLNYREMNIGKEIVRPILNREGAIEIIMTLYFTNDWWPSKSLDWSYLQNIPRRMNANNHHNVGRDTAN